MASVIGNPRPDGSSEPVVAPELPKAAPGGMRFEEVFVLDLDTFLGPVKRALRAHLSAEPDFPMRRRGRKPAAPAPA